MYPEQTQERAPLQETAFRVFASIMQHARVLYLPEMTGYLAILAAYDQCLGKLSPALADHLEKNEINAELASLYLQDWIHTLFCRAGVPHDVSIALWGWFIQSTSSKELCDMLLRTSLAIVLGMEDAIFRASGTQSCLWVLKNPPWGTNEFLHPHNLVYRAAGLLLPTEGKIRDFEHL
jgi:hypothetical protein